MAEDDRGIIEDKIINALIEGDLSGDGIVELQTNLKELGYFSANPFPNFGQITARSTLDFLNDHPEQAFLISADIAGQMHSAGLGVETQALIRSTAAQYMTTEQREAITQNMNTLLAQEETWDSNQIQQIQTNLSRLGYEFGPIDSRYDPQTSEAITSYIHDNPASFNTISTTSLRKIINSGQYEELREFAQAHPDIITDRIQNSLNEINGDYINGDWQDKIELQTMLSIGGYSSPNNIDGVIGGQARTAINNFAAAHPDATIPEPLPDPNYVDYTPPEPLKEASHYVGGTNGLGISNTAIERAWADITGDTPPIGNVTPSGRPLIILDLGHGVSISNNENDDIGAMSPHIDDLSEVAFIDAIADDLAQALYEQGYDVAFTRNPGELLRVKGQYADTLTSRPEFAHNLAEQIGATNVTFISMHANSATSTRADGSLVFVQQNNNGDSLSASSENLGQSIAGTYQLDSSEPTEFRQANYSVLRNFERDIPSTADHTMYSATLIEFGFLSNASDSRDLVRMMNDPERAVEQLVRGINMHIQFKDPDLDLQPRPDASGLNGTFTNAQNGDTPAPATARDPDVPLPNAPQSDEQQNIQQNDNPAERSDFGGLGR